MHLWVRCEFGTAATGRTADVVSPDLPGVVCPECARSVPGRCPEWDSNPHALSDNGF